MWAFNALQLYFVITVSSPKKAPDYIKSGAFLFYSRFSFLALC
ncbi:hypothetical protein J2W55_001111 [Mucilaginibacter pocheonensis]|uniref:Uncharacterized protein n=1 Tax=Mucilaginibacter pocheonensis TaxID=398050 RepID=A0ABU1T7A2_9SPHI|nr:hypothetical protein [Mucilaginibacter pocheonensis]